MHNYATQNAPITILCKILVHAILDLGYSAKLK